MHPRTRASTLAHNTPVAQHICARARTGAHRCVVHTHKSVPHTNTSFACNTLSGPHIQASMHVQIQHTAIPALDVQYKRIAAGHWVCCIKLSYLIRHVSKRVHPHLHRRVHACQHSQMHVSTCSHHTTAKSSETVLQNVDNCSVGDVLMSVG